ncbi:MAG: 2-C-methyl-D-erythritol 4-phosphate cytidylyltransferase [Solirubrobacterales bacterium]
MAAAGSGERLGAGGPKALVPLAGRPMLEWSLAAFGACPGVAAIVVAAPPGAVPGSVDRPPEEGPAGPVEGGGGAPVRYVAGGATRAESVGNALALVETELVAIHDAARPLVTPALVQALLAALEAAPQAAGVIAAAPVTDTIKRAGSSSTLTTKYVGNVELRVTETIDRSALWGAQTPQVFRTAVLREALAVDEATRDAATDEAMLVERAGGAVLIHHCVEPNLKVTTPLDLRVAELLLAERGTAR